MTNKEILNKSSQGERISFQEGLQLLSTAELLDLGEAATEIRYRYNPKEQVTFVIDTNPNYTNICEIDCTFCAFYRHEEDSDAYTFTVDEMIQKFKDSAKRGVTTVLLQGGVNPKLPFQYYLDLVRRTREEVHEIHPHFFSTSEIIGMSEVSSLSVKEVLQELWKAGLRTIPGGGAEILSDRVKRKMSRLKGKTDDWLFVMKEAQQLGYKTTATMMYGHIETDEDIVIHLEAIRNLQDETNG
ncbi:MAG: radical SAM protein, partial [Bacteroidetes bacterium]|nr:radical SAM protein [Bacteroidota bacterium]